MSSISAASPKTGMADCHNVSNAFIQRLRRVALTAGEPADNGLNMGIQSRKGLG